MPFCNQLPRFYELKDLLNDPSHPDAYFRDFVVRLQDETCLDTFAVWEKELQSLDPAAWTCLRSKASHYLKRRERGRGHQQRFDALGEAFAYNHLRQSAGCSKVSFIPERDVRTPDLEGVLGCGRILCEVKTINISDDEVGARRAPHVVRKRSNELSKEFLRKLDSVITDAKGQHIF